MAETLIRCALDEDAPWPSRVAAACAVLDRSLGKPAANQQQHGSESETIGALRIEFVSAAGDQQTPEQQAINGNRTFEVLEFDPTQLDK